MKKKVLSLLLASAMVFSLVACNKDTGSTTPSGSGAGASNAGDNSGSAAPQVTDYDLKEIKVMVDGTLNLDEENGLNEFQTVLSEKIGVNVTINKVDHSGYADALARALTTKDNRPDVVLMSAQYYAQYAAYDGFLWDMTDAYNNAKFRSRVTREGVNENNKVNGKMLGFSPAIGNGCITYVKQFWLDNVGVKAEDIKTFDDYYNLLLKFTKEDPDGDGKNGNTYGVIAAGLISNEAPWTNYMPEFWQDAYPALMQDASGKWVDGFKSDATKAALERLKKGWDDGVIDPDTSAFYGKTKDTREKWFSATQSGSEGCFTYWAGTWRETLYNNLDKNKVLGKDGNTTQVAMLPKIAELPGFIDRNAPVWVILNDGDDSNNREQKIFDAFFESMMDGDYVQTMWEYGVEGLQWSVKAEDVALKVAPKDGVEQPDKVTTYKEGEFHMLPQVKDPTKLYSKNHIDNLLVIAPLTNGYATLTPMVDEANMHFNASSVAAPAVPSSESYSNNATTITDAVHKAVDSFVKDGVSYEDMMKTYDAECSSAVEAVLAELNAQ